MFEQETCQDEAPQEFGPEKFLYSPLPNGIVLKMKPYEHSFADFKPLNFNPLTEEELANLTGSSLLFYQLLQKYTPGPEWDTNSESSLEKLQNDAKEEQDSKDEDFGPYSIIERALRCSPRACTSRIERGVQFLPETSSSTDWPYWGVSSTGGDPEYLPESSMAKTDQPLEVLPEASILPGLALLSATNEAPNILQDTCITTTDGALKVSMESLSTRKKHYILPQSCIAVTDGSLSGSTIGKASKVSSKSSTDKVATASKNAAPKLSPEGSSSADHTTVSSHDYAPEYSTAHTQEASTASTDGASEDLTDKVSTILQEASPSIHVASLVLPLVSPATTDMVSGVSPEPSIYGDSDGLSAAATITGGTPEASLDTSMGSVDRASQAATADMDSEASTATMASEGSLETSADGAFAILPKASKATAVASDSSDIRTDVAPEVSPGTSTIVDGSTEASTSTAGSSEDLPKSSADGTSEFLHNASAPTADGVPGVSSVADGFTDVSFETSTDSAPKILPEASIAKTRQASSILHEASTAAVQAPEVLPEASTGHEAKVSDGLNRFPGASEVPDDFKKSSTEISATADCAPGTSVQKSISSLHEMKLKEFVMGGAMARREQLHLSWDRDSKLTWREIMQEDLQQFMEVMDQIKNKNQPEYDSWVSSLKLCQVWGDDHSERLQRSSTTKNEDHGEIEEAAAGVLDEEKVVNDK